MITKSYSKSGAACRVTFQLTSEEAVESAAVVGDWNGWDPAAHRLERRHDGAFSLTVSLPAGQSYRFRYLLDGSRWANDNAADAVVANLFGSEDAVLALVPPAQTHTAETVVERVAEPVAGSVSVRPASSPRPRKVAKPRLAKAPAAPPKAPAAKAPRSAVPRKPRPSKPKA